ncbi:unnamed protein product, partial [Adineta steineri]
LFIEKRNRNGNTNEKFNHEYQVPRNDANYNDIFSVTNPYIPVYDSIVQQLQLPGTLVLYSY